MPVIDDDGNVGYHFWEFGGPQFTWFGLNRRQIMKYPITDQDMEELNKRFTYHPPKEDQPDRYVLLRNKAHALAEDIMVNVPPSRERSLALTNLEESIFWANAGIARNE